MAVWWIAASVLAVLVVLYAWWTARRLDRLHRRLDAAAAALDEQLIRRAEAASGVGSEQLRAATTAALSLRGRLDHEREAAENAFVEATEAQLYSAGDGSVQPVPPALLEQFARTAVARRFYNDAVRDVLVVRDRRIVRWAYLAGHAPRPSYVELDDGAPADRHAAGTSLART